MAPTIPHVARLFLRRCATHVAPSAYPPHPRANPTPEIFRPCRGTEPFTSHAASLILECESTDKRLMRVLRDLARDDAAATMVEYAIMVALIAAVCIALISTLGKRVSSAFSSVNGSL